MRTEHQDYGQLGYGGIASFYLAMAVLVLCILATSVAILLTRWGVLDWT